MTYYVICGIVCIGCIIGIVYCLNKLKQKQNIDRSELFNYQDKLKVVINELKITEEQNDHYKNLAEEAQEKYNSILVKYKQMTEQNQEDLDLYFAKQKEFRQSELDTEFERQERERKESLDLRMKTFTEQAQEQINKAEIAANEEIEKFKKAQQEIADVTLFQEERYESLLAPLQQYEKDRQEKLFYTIQVPDEYKQDIDFLLTTASTKLSNIDAINKLIWNEYLKPAFDDLVKRTNITAAPGIYKITSLSNGKCYIGKSTDVKKRLGEHIKGAIGISSISDQAIHHAIKKEGFSNWTIEVIIYCDKEKLSELEKYYIDFFKAQEYGYNKRAGG